MHRDKWPDMRMKHLELMQGVIARMGSNGAGLKGYCMGIVAAFIGLAGAVDKPRILLLCLPIVFVFAVLDAAYLALERGFRNHYDILRTAPLDNEPDFEICVHDTPSLFSVAKSWSIVLFYGSAALILAVTSTLM